MVVCLLASGAGLRADPVPPPWRTADQHADRLEVRADALIRAKRIPEAEPFLDAAVEVRERLQGPGAAELAYPLGRRAGIARRDGDVAAERDLTRRVLAIERASKGAGHGDAAAALGEYADVRRRQGYQGEAEPRLRKAWHRLEEARGPFDPYMYEKRPLPDRSALEAERVGVALYRDGRLDEAERLFMRAERIWARELGADDPRVVRLRWRMSRIRAKLGKRYADRPFVGRANGARFEGCGDPVPWAERGF